MKQNRQGLFETNSSSVHAIVITKNNNIEIPKDLPILLELETVDFGWEVDRYNDFLSKLQYLYNACESCEIYKPRLDAFLNEVVGIELVDYTPGYVDHGYETADFLEFIFSDINNFKRFLFSPDSFIQTGNDNGCMEEVDEVEEQYSSDPGYDIFFKGN